MRRTITIFLSSLMLLALITPGEATAESARRRVPLAGIYLQPNLSLMLPGTEVISELYGSAHPTGTVGFGLHPSERFSLALELEGHGWRGSSTTPGGATFNMRFLNYWFHLRGRVFFWQRDRFALGIDGVFGMLFSREDGDRYRASGEGVAVGAGPSAQFRLGRHMALSLSVIVEGGWGWYDIESPQSREGDSEYTLAWPRVLIGLGIHGFVIQRTIRPSSPETQAPSPADDHADPPAPPPREAEPPSPFKSWECARPILE